MARSVLVDAGFLVALFNRRDSHHPWAKAQALEAPPPWETCEAALSETFHLLGKRGLRPLTALLDRQAVVVGFELGLSVKPDAWRQEAGAGKPAMAHA